MTPRRTPTLHPSPQGGGKTLALRPDLPKVEPGAAVDQLREVSLSSLPLEGRDKGWGYCETVMPTTGITR